MSKLSAIKFQKATPRAKEYTLADGEGLFLHIKPNGSKIWKFRFYWNDVQGKISFGATQSVFIYCSNAYPRSRQDTMAASAVWRMPSTEMHEILLLILDRYWFFPEKKAKETQIAGKP